MPDESKAQFRFMEAVKHNAKFAKKVGVPQSVGEDFSAAQKAEGTPYKELPERVKK
jgi:hypothetical protein